MILLKEIASLGESWSSELFLFPALVMLTLWTHSVASVENHYCFPGGHKRKEQLTRLKPKTYVFELTSFNNSTNIFPTWKIVIFTLPFFARCDWIKSVQRYKKSGEKVKISSRKGKSNNFHFANCTISLKWIEIVRYYQNVFSINVEITSQHANCIRLWSMKLNIFWNWIFSATHLLIW